MLPLFLGILFLTGVGILVWGIGPKQFSATAARAISRFREEARPILPNRQFEQALEALPAPVQKWLSTTGALQRAPFWLGRLTQRARMRMKPEDPAWHQATALQYSRAGAPGFVWAVKMPLFAGFNILGRDSFGDGKGRMLITLNGLIPLVNAHGDQIDEGSLQRYLGELVWFPTLALSPYIRWEPVDALTARARIQIGATSGSGTFHFNEAGDFVRFEAMRFKDAKPGAPRYPWILTVQAYRSFEGIRIPSSMQATWQLPEGDWTWLELEVTDLQTNGEALEQPLVF